MKNILKSLTQIFISITAVLCLFAMNSYAMKGFPKYLNTKYDYEYVKEYFLEDQWKPAWQALLDTRMNWLNTAMLDLSDPGITDETHRVVEIRDNNDVVTQKYQQEYILDPNCKLLRLGFTVEEIQNALSE